MEMVRDIAVMIAAMAWEILWPLVLGFALSGVVQALVSQNQVSRLMPDDRPRSIATALALGAASSSCSYAAVALARSLFRKGANFTAAMVFEVASTNLVAELAIILVVLMGWQFALAEGVGAILMAVLLVLLLRGLLGAADIAAAKAQADKGIAGRMEGHAGMDMSIGGDQSILAKLFSARGFTAVSHYFVMDWASVWIDVALGLVIAGALAVLVPDAAWNALFLTRDPAAAKIIGPFIGPLIAMLSFVCSVGNIPLAAVLWNGGISFGGVVGFIFADLLVLPILDIYRKYYGLKVMALLSLALYLAMALAALAVELLFGVLGLIPTARHAGIARAAFAWDYTSVLNIGFLLLAAVLLWRFLKTGGPAMLRAMEQPADAPHDHGHCH